MHQSITLTVSGFYYKRTDIYYSQVSHTPLNPLCMRDISILKLQLLQESSLAKGMLLLDCNIRLDFRGIVLFHPCIEQFVRKGLHNGL